VTLLPIHLLGSPVLRERAGAIAGVTPEVRALVDDLFATMRAEQGVGLAANQVGRTERVAVVDTTGDDPLVLINPEILEREGTQTGEEGCLSIPEIYADVERARRILLATTQLDGSRVELEATEFRARAIQHEIDHLDGILFLDRLSPLKRRMLLKKWQKVRKGAVGYLKEVSAHTE
jgi:peptide deformylase